MRRSALADTGALVALLDRGDRWHPACAAAFPQLRLPLLTSTAVLTELFHLVGDSRPQVDSAWRLVRSGALTVGSVGDADLPTIEDLMTKYHDRPMDFADATLVLLASRAGIDTVFTVDVDDFETYRIQGKRRFRVVPGRASPG